MLTKTNKKTEKNPLLPKRQTFVELRPDQQQPEREAVSRNIEAGQETVGIDRSQQISGKVASILTELRAVQEKVSTLGTGIADQFRQYLHQRTQISIDPSNAQNAQNEFNRWLRSNEGMRQLSESNNQGYQRLNTALDQVMLKVQMRKELARNLDELEDTEKNSVGSLFESRIGAEEGTIEAPNFQIENFRYRLEVIHEFTKYAKLVKLTRGSNPAATSIETAKVLPEGTAYPRNDGNVAFMKYWVEVPPGTTTPVIYAIDNVYGRIQKFDPRIAFDPAHRMAWVYADVALTGPTANDAARQQRAQHGNFYENRWANWHTTASAERQRRMPTSADITPEIMAQLVQNQRYERAFISGDRRSFTAGGTPDSMATAEVQIATGQFERFTTEFNRLRDEHNRLYTTTQPGQQPYGHHLREMYTTVTNPTYRTNIPTYTPTSTPTAGPTSGPGTGPSTVPRETTEVSRRNNSLLVSPRNGMLNWGGTPLQPGSTRLALLQAQNGLQRREIKTILINGRPSNALINTWVRLSANNRELTWVNPNAVPMALFGNLTIVLEDEETSGVKILQTITLERGERLPLTQETAREATTIDPTLMTRGKISVEGLSWLSGRPADRRIAELPNVRNTITRSITGVELNGQQKLAGDIIYSGNGLVLPQSGSIDHLEPGNTLRLTFLVTDTATTPATTETVVQTITIPPESSEIQESIQVSLQADGKVYFGALNNHTFIQPVAIGELSNLPAGYSRAVLDQNNQPHSFLMIDGNRVVVKSGSSVNIPIGPMPFRVGITNGNNIVTKDYTVTNEEPSEAVIPELPETLRSGVTLRRGEIMSATNGQDIVGLPAARTGVHRNVSAFTIDPETPVVDFTDDNFVFRAGTGGTEMLSFIDSVGGLRRTIPEGRTLTLTIQSLNEGGNVLKTEQISLITGPAEAPRPNAIQLENAETIDATQGRRIQLGHQLAASTTDRPLGPLGVRLSTDLPLGANVRVAEVFQGTRNGNPEVVQGGARNGEPIIGYENGQLVLRANNRLNLGRHFVKLESIQGGARQEHWIAIENQPLPPPSASDVAFLPGTPENIQGPLDARTSPNGINIAQLVPRREGTIRWIHMMTINGVLHNSLSPTFPIMYRGDQGFMIHFNEETGLLTLPAGAHISPSGSPARIDLNFMVIVPGSGAQLIRRTINVLPGPQPSPTAQPIETSQRVLGEAEQSQLRENLAMRDLLYETWNTTTSWNLMKARLNNFPQSAAIDRFTLATIDANSGRLAVSNDGHSTLLDIRGHEIVIHGGPAASEAEMRFPNTVEGARSAMVFAAASNRIMNDCINKLGLNALDKFDSAHRDGTFFELDGGTIQVESGGTLGGLTEDNVWVPTSADSVGSKSAAFIGLLNKMMADHVGTNNGISGRASDGVATLEHSLDVNTARAVWGQAFSLGLRNLSADMIYSYSGNRVDWHQVPRDVTGNHTLSISPGEISRSGTYLERAGTNGIKEYFMILTLCATPRNASDPRRPRIISLEIPIVNAYRPDRTGERSFIARGNAARINDITYNLDGGIISRQAGRRYTTGENLTIREQPHSDGRLVVLKNGTPFSYVGLSPTGLPQAEFINEGDSNTYSILAPATTGSTRSLQFKEL